MISIAEIIASLKPVDSYCHDFDTVISELVFDSRRVSLPAQTLFFAIKTEKNDGHQFVESLINKGVRNFIITGSVSSFRQYGNCNFIQVRDAVAALQQLAVFRRNKFNLPVIGITGSNGKTIVKEWLAQMLAADFNVVKNPNSYNSQIGVPFSVWQINENHTLGIFEAGISKPGEMEKLAGIIKPTIGILTNIGAAHAQFFKDDREKTVEKLKLFSYSSCLIYCSDNRNVHDILNRPEYAHLRKISWGMGEEALYRIKSKKRTENSTIVELDSGFFEIPFIDDASVENAVHAAVLLHFLNFPFLRINQKLALLTPVSMRMEMKEAVNHSIIINDTYSLDMNSLKIALDFLDAQKQFSKKTVIMSDFEQVALSDEDYKEIGTLLGEKGITRLIAIGEKFTRKRAFFTIKEQYFYPDTEAFIADMASISFREEAILVKGARSYRFEKIVDLLQFKTHQTVMNINLPNLVHNLNYYRSLIRPQTKVMAMVKALSYGLGDAELINELQYHNVDYLAVAYTDEGVKLREQNIKLPVVVLGAEAHSFEVMIRYGLEPEIYNFYYLEKLGKTLALYPGISGFKIHIKIDTGMHRLGFSPEETDALIRTIQRNPQLRVASVFSHLAAAEDPEEDDFTRSQIALFEEVSDKIIASFPYPVLRHILNSAGISRFAEAQFDMVRLGIGLYGFPQVEADRKFMQNVVTLKTIITQIKTIGKGESVGYNRSFFAEKEMKIAVIPIGYADGFGREFSNGGGAVLVKNRYADVVGKVCMDMCMIDVTGIEVSEGEEVIVYGDRNLVDDAGKKVHKTAYELLTSISRRVPRIYVKD